MRKYEKQYERTENYGILQKDISVSIEMIKGSITNCYETLDMIDKNLVARGSQKMSKLVELANLSSIIGNLLGAGFAASSSNEYERNKPHAYPDLIATNVSMPGIEIKTALLKNSPKGHQPKPGYYLTYRYCLTDENGNREIGIEYTWDTATIWEVKFGYLSEDDFSCSNTAGDSGKTAVIRTASFNAMKLLYLDESLVPYKHSESKPYKGYN